MALSFVRVSGRIFCLLFLILLDHLSISSEMRSIAIEGTLVSPEGPFKGNVEITLNAGQFATMALSDGSFTFYNIPSGVYSLDVLAMHELYPQMKLKVDAEADSVTVVEFKFPGANRKPVTYPLRISALASQTYFQQRPPFSLLGMLMGNPMLLMMLFSFGLVALMPMLTQGMDEEQLKELQGEVDAADPMKNFKKMMGMPTSNNDDDDED